MTAAIALGSLGSFGSHLASWAQPAPPEAPVDTSIATPHIDWAGLAPVLILIAGALLLLMVASFARRSATTLYAISTVVVAGAAIVASIPLWIRVHDDDRGPFATAAGAIGIDGFSVFFAIIICVAVILAALLAEGYLRRENLPGAELFVLMLLSAAGGIVMAAANDLVVIFLGLEILSIAVYVLAAMHRRRLQSQEAALKYFVLGAFSSAFFLYGIALVYGATGSTNLRNISLFASSPDLVVRGGGVLEAGHPTALLLAGIALLLVGFGFKIAAAPFHSWAPDVYQGSPSPIVAFMASGVKAAGFAGLIRVFTLAFGTYADDWQPYIYALAVATLLLGAILAVVQTDVKRMLAYSSISHAGFILVAMQAASDDGVAAALFYIAAYTFMVAGSFGVVTLVGRRGDDRHALDDYRGLGRAQPLLALTFTIFLLAQAGVPLTAGFFAKFYALRAAVEADSWPLALIAMLSAVIAAFLYLRIIVAIYMAPAVDTAEAAEGATAAAGTGAAAGAGADESDDRAGAPERIRVPVAAGFALAAAAAFTLVFGFQPSPIADVSGDAVPTIPAPATSSTTSTIPFPPGG